MVGFTNDDVDAMLTKLRSEGNVQKREPCPAGCGGYKVKANSCTYCSNNEMVNPETTIKCMWGVCE